MRYKTAALEVVPNDARSAVRTLALIRIAAGLVIAFSADVHAAPRFATLDPQLVAPPASLHWLSGLVVPRAVAEALRWTVVGAAIAGALGCYARAAYGVTAIALFWLLALSQRLGAVTHNHHLLWVATLLAVSPCADGWSADAHFEKIKLRAPGSYAVPVAYVRGLVAAIYFFPGVHKLAAFLRGVEPGAWLRSQLDWKWMQAGHDADLPFALTPMLCTMLALGALAFELGMPALLLWRRSRLWALGLAVAFHLATAKLLFIRFESLAAVLSSLLEVGPAAGRASLRTLWRDSFLSTRIVGSVLLLGACLTGALGITQSYPFACYPTFAQPAPATMPSARVEVTTGHAHCTLARPRSNAEWVQAWRIAGAYEDPLSEARARAYLRQTLQAHPRDCQLTANSLLTLTREQLAWNVSTRSVRIVSERAVYAMAVASLGSAPAEGASGTSESSSPPR